MNRRSLAINSGLALVVVAVGFGGYLTVGDPGKATASTSRSVAVSTGAVTATVTGSGNLASGGDTTVSASQCSGKLTSILVTLGQTVKSRQALGYIDTTTAQQNLDSAKATLTQDKASASASTASAQQSLMNAQASQNLDISQAQQTLSTAQQAVAGDQAAVQTARTALITARAAAHPNTQTISSAESTYTSAASKLSQDVASVTQAQAQLASTQLKDSQQVATAQVQLDQTSSGVGSGSSSSNLVSAQQAVGNAETALADCTLTAPVSGVITALTGSVGSTVGSSSSSGSSGSSASSTSTATTSTSTSSSSGFATISNLATMQVTAAIAEADISSVKIGQKVTLTFPAVTDSADPSGITTPGAVSAISPTSTVSSGVVTYTVSIRVNSPPEAVRLGQTTNVSITTAAKDNVIRVVSTAISSAGGVKTVNRTKGASMGTVVVGTGVSGGGFTEITTGLQAGDEVALPTVATSTTTGGFGGRTGVGGVAGGLG